MSKRSHCRLMNANEQNHRFENRFDSSTAGRRKQRSSEFGDDLVLDEFVEGSKSKSELLRFTNQRDSIRRNDWED